MEYKHISVMLNEVIEYLDPKEGDNFIDCTLGGAGYTSEIARRIAPSGKMIATDMDTLALDNAEKKLKREGIKNVILVHDNFQNLKEIVKKNWKDEKGFDGIVYDIGFSSAQLDDKKRGFSFQDDTPLKMEFGERSENKTVDIVNKWKQERLERILREYGEEKFAKRISTAIVEVRKDREIETTGELVEVIRNAVPGIYKNNRKLHFATKTFQALRIATNTELENIEKSIPQAVDLLKKGGRVAVISFHSLEDRIVKRIFKDLSRDCICPPEIPVCRCDNKAKVKIISRKVILPSEEEVKNNLRSRSAKMRVAEKL